MRRVSRPNPDNGDESASSADELSLDLCGAAAAYGNALLFIGYPVDGMLEVVVYPRYRFSSDDRVQGHLGNLRFAPGTNWVDVLRGVDELSDRAQDYYRRAVTSRAAEMRAHGSRYEAAYDAITELCRESWHGFALRLRRDGRQERAGVRFEGSPPGPVLVTYNGDEYTLHVSTTGSILLVTGNRRSELF